MNARHDAAEMRLALAGFAMAALVAAMVIWGTLGAVRFQTQDRTNALIEIGGAL